jgi:hypothetical protein
VALAERYFPQKKSCFPSRSRNYTRAPHELLNTMNSVAKGAEISETEPQKDCLQSFRFFKKGLTFGRKFASKLVKLLLN